MSSSVPSTVQTGMDPAYETSRVIDETSFLRKLRTKRRLYRLVGEIYVGKRVKLVYFRDWLKRLPLPESPAILEVGSGEGLFCFTTATMLPDAHVDGMELNTVEAKACRQRAAEEGFANLRFDAGVLSDFGWKDRFDLVFCLDVLEHIRDDYTAVEEMKTALKPGGALLVHVPNRHYLDVDRVLRTVPDDEAWKINPGHFRNGYTPVELQTLLEKAGLIVREVRQTQGRPIAKAHRLYRRIERFLPLRIAILPIIDWWIRSDRKQVPAHGNTLWAWAEKPAS